MGCLPAAADDVSALLAKHKALVGRQMGDGSIRTLRYVQIGRDAKQAVFDTAAVIRPGATSAARAPTKKAGRARISDMKLVPRYARLRADQFQSERPGYR